MSDAWPLAAWQQEKICRRIIGELADSSSCDRGRILMLLAFLGRQAISSGSNFFIGHLLNVK